MYREEWRSESSGKAAPVASEYGMEIDAEMVRRAMLVATLKSRMELVVTKVMRAQFHLRYTLTYGSADTSYINLE